MQACIWFPQYMQKANEQNQKLEDKLNVHESPESSDDDDKDESSKAKDIPPSNEITSVEQSEENEPKKDK